MTSFSNIDEFGAGSCSCSGVMTGCTVCSTANVLVAFGKSIPRLAGGTPDMRTLGARMGAKCRAEDGCRHGLSLTGSYCTTGTWCALCSWLELRAAGIPVRFEMLTWAGIMAQLEKGHVVVTRIWYGRIPRVSTTSYDRTTPARGRSDSFLEWHMVDLWGLDGRGHIYVSDSDFGSAARPVVPPYSLWNIDDVRSAWSAGNSAVTHTTVPVPTSSTVQLPSARHQEEDMLKYMPPITDPQRMALKKGQRLYAFPGGPRVTSMSKDAAVAHLGSGSSRAGGHPWRQVVVGTGIPYSDGKSRRTGLWVPADAGKVVNA